MAQPTVYFGNLFADGSLVSSESADTNPVRRIADGSINLNYLLGTFSGGDNWDVIQVSLPTAARASALTVNRADIPSGTQFIVDSFDTGGGNRVTHADFTTSADAIGLVQVLTGVVSDRQEWRLTVSGSAGPEAWKVAEVQLTSGLLTMQRPQVGVGRTRLRQFGRFPVPNGQPFVRRRGPRLRQLRYSFLLVSGAQVTDSEAFIDAVEGGQAFTLVDDTGSQLWAELMGEQSAFDDQAGVNGLELLFQEIRRD